MGDGGSESASATEMPPRSPAQVMTRTAAGEKSWRWRSTATGFETSFRSHAKQASLSARCVTASRLALGSPSTF